MKEKLEAKDGIPPDQMRFVFAGKELRDERSIADYNVCGTVTVYATTGLLN